MNPPSSGGRVVGAAVDLGSNSVHLLAVAIDGHRLDPLIDESVFLGLGSAVAEHGRLGGDARAGLAGAVQTYVRRAQEAGARQVTLLGTEPIRRAADASRIVHDVTTASGMPLHVISHEEEAYLTLIGVTQGMPVERPTLVVDTGGGSTEFCIVDPVTPARAAGLQLGSARLTDRFVRHDPPIADEIEAMRVAARAIVRDAPIANHAEIVAVGGTASNLLKVLPGGPAGGALSRDDLAAAQATLATEPAAAASERHLVNPIRARILPAGAVILEAILDHYGVDRLRVSEAGLREGAILAVAHVGVAWRDRLAVLAQGWRV